METSDQWTAQSVAPEPAAAPEPVEMLPTMADLDRLAADLDRIDLTLVEIDGPAQETNTAGS